VGGPARGAVTAGTLNNDRHDTLDAFLLDRPPGPGLGEQLGPGFDEIEQFPEVSRQGTATGRAGRDGEPAGQPLFRVEPTKDDRALPEEIPVPVSTTVNNPRSQGPDCIQPLEV
jgi:hypothetical protein